MIQLIFTGCILLVISLSLIPTAAIGGGIHSWKYFEECALDKYHISDTIAQYIHLTEKCCFNKGTI